MNNLYTFGYQNKKLDAFKTILIKYGIGAVIDIRRKPFCQWSYEWRKNFLLSWFRKESENSKIDCRYFHDSRLGNYHDKLPWCKHPNHQDGIDNIMLLLPDWNVLLLCLEQDFNKCHRTEVALSCKSLQDDLQIIHLPESNQQSLF